ncbi:MAG: ThuA domain-containing protein [Blautia sp.]|nr:ThuA domain-containing protein [Blautia sp.]
MERIQVLLVTGKVTEEHQFRVTNEKLRTLLESTGRFYVTITEEGRNLTPEYLAPYDVILLHYDGKSWPTDKAVRLGETTENSFYQFAAEGKGIVFYHSTAWVDEDWPDEWRKLMGGYVTMMDGRRAPADDLIIKTSDPEHAICKDVKKEWMAVIEDLFTPVHFHPESKVHVLQSVYDDILYYQELFDKGLFPPKHHPVHIPEGKLENMAGVNQDTPVMWTNEYGKGRVFVTTIGHGPGTWERFSFITLFVRGVEWAATGAVTLNAPDRSGDNRLKQWPYY